MERGMDEWLVGWMDGGMEGGRMWRDRSMKEYAMKSVGDVWGVACDLTADGWHRPNVDITAEYG